MQNICSYDIISVINSKFVVFKGGGYMKNELESIGKGNTAEVFKYGEDKVCKLFYEGYPPEYVELEYKNAREVFKLKLAGYLRIIECCRQSELSI